MIRVALLDDHPAVLAGLDRLLGRSEGLRTVALADRPESLFRALERSPADVVVVDYDLARGDGLSVCQRLKDRAHAPAVVVYSAYAGPALAIAARIAGADAVVDKGNAAANLVDVVRRVAGGEQVLPDVPLYARAAALRRLEPEDVPVASMRLSGTPLHGIAEALVVDRREVARRIRRIVGRLRARRTVSAGAGQPRRAPSA